jgi:hypothetical protein
VTEWDALVSRLALAEAKVMKLCAAVTSAEEAAEWARTTAATTKAAARDAAQSAAHEKTMLETKVADLERDLGTATVDLAANQVQEISEEATWLRKSNAKLLENLEGESSTHFPSPSHFVVCFLEFPDLFLDISGMRMYRARMTLKLAEQKQEMNTALLKVIEKDGAIECLSEQLQTKSRISVPSPSSCGPAITCHHAHLLEAGAKLEKAQMAREQDAVALNQAQNVQRESEAAGQRNIEDLAKLGRAIGTVMAGLGVSLGPVMPETLVEEVGRLPDVVRELELATAQRAVHRVLAMFESHYQGLYCMALSGG